MPKYRQDDAFKLQVEKLAAWHSFQSHNFRHIFNSLLTCQHPTIWKLLDTDDTVECTVNLKCTVRRKRRKMNHRLVNPENAADIVFPSHYQVDHAGRRFLLADKITNNGKKVFSTDTGLDSLQAPDRTVSFIDGTYKCSPIHFKLSLTTISN